MICDQKFLKYSNLFSNNIRNEEKRKEYKKENVNMKKKEGI